MPRVSKKAQQAQAEKLQQQQQQQPIPANVAPQPVPQQMMPNPNQMAHQGNMQQQYHHPQQHQQLPQHQQFMPMQMQPQQPQQQLPPMGVPIQQQPQQHQQQFQQPPPQQPVQAGRAQVVDAENFRKVRDSAVTRMSTMIELLRKFTADYKYQTDLLLGDNPTELPQPDLFANLDSAAAQLLAGVNPVLDLGAPAEEKKERKKRSHDPNAPKRPLTPYFLYMQHARSIIANDLGPESPKGAVQEEGQRRWASMSAQEKDGWNHAYQYNLRLYQARMASYKAGNPDAKDMSDDDAAAYAESNNIPMPTGKDAAAQDASQNDQDAIAQQLQQQVGPATVMMPDDTKTPKKAAGGRKRKSEVGEAPSNMGTPVQAGAASPDKKRRRSGKQAPAEAVEEPKKGGRKKTKSS